jgi:hypothetical protein
MQMKRFQKIKSKSKSIKRKCNAKTSNMKKCKKKLQFINKEYRA